MNDFKNFITHLKLESFALAVLMITIAVYSPEPFWIVFVAFPIFDIGLFGYARNPKFGALTYNIMHNMTIPTLLLTFGFILPNDIVTTIGYCWIFHISIDRLLGFGLKHTHSFHETHLGVIKNKNRVKS